jgi:fatty acid-binding protein DegV
VVAETGGGVIGLCTDSNSQLPPVLAERFGIEVVPLTVIADEHEYLEGINLDADGFYDLFTPEHRPDITFGVPSPGQFAVAYDDLAERGCTQILSVHTSAAVEGTLNAARLAAKTAPVPVRLIDPGIARVGVSCCVWAMADALADGATVDDAAAVAEALAPTIRNVYVVGGLKLLDGVVLSGGGISLLSLEGDNPARLGRVHSATEAVEFMLDYTLAWGEPVKVAIGTAHRDCLPIADALAAKVAAAADVVESVRFRIGPSVGAETGPGTVGCVFYPA